MLLTKGKDVFFEKTPQQRLAMCLKSFTKDRAPRTPFHILSQDSFLQKNRRCSPNQGQAVVWKGWISIVNCQSMKSLRLA